MSTSRSAPGRSHPYRQVPYLLNSLPGPLHHAPLAFAHRGADPTRENTMAAFRRAVQLGYRYLEIDVRTSADGELVVFHDETLDRITDGSGNLSDKTWAELAELRVIGAGEEQARRRTSAGELTDTAAASEAPKPTPPPPRRCAAGPFLGGSAGLPRHPLQRRPQGCRLRGALRPDR